MADRCNEVVGQMTPQVSFPCGWLRGRAGLLVALSAYLTSGSADAGVSASIPDVSPQVLPLLRAEEAQRLPFRAVLPELFADAYARYPRLPQGILEALAFVGSRWVHRMPESAFDDHLHMPAAYGLMGLYHGQGGFGDGVAEAAAALGVSEDAVMRDPGTHVLATAALLDRLCREEGLGMPLVEELGPVLFRLSGLPGRGDVDRFAQNAYFYDVLLTLERGHDDAGIRIQPQPIDWSLAFRDDVLDAMQSPVVRLTFDRDIVEVAGGERVRFGLEGREADSAEKSAPQTTDYAPALWVTSPNYSSRSGTAITNVAIHTMQGSYSGSISWCSNPDADVSAHYLMRSSDGQVTQMVWEKDKAWHVGSENPYTIGIEHEGYVDTASYYTTAMYNSSSALTKDICASNKIDCSTCYSGASSSSVQVLSIDYRVKGHQHYPNQSHTDPGKYWDWPKYKSLLTGSTSGSSGGSTGGTTTTTTTILDSFESSEGHFNTSPTYSGTTQGISTSSTAERSNSVALKPGLWSERLTLKDNTSSTSNWQVRFLSASGSVSSNVAMTRSGGKFGFWVYTASSGVTVAALMDDSDGIEVSTSKAVTQNTWTFVEWALDDGNQWSAWYAGNGSLTASTVTLDAIMIYRANSSSTVDVYIDDVQYKKG